MSRRMIYGAVSAASLVLIAVALVALLVPNEGISRLIAFLALVMTFGKTVYDVWKKEGETKERVKATPVFTSYDLTQAFGVELYGAGNAAVAIKRVALAVKTDNGDVLEFMLSESEAERLGNGIYQEAASLPESVSRFELAPKKHVRFFLDRHTEWTCDRLLGMPADSFCIAVDSFMGTVARVDGGEIQAAILNTPRGRAINGVRRKLRALRVAAVIDAEEV
jgi:hypothetical protein